MDPIRVSLCQSLTSRRFVETAAVADRGRLILLEWNSSNLRKQGYSPDVQFSSELRTSPASRRSGMLSTSVDQRLSTVYHTERPPLRTTRWA